ncbi:MAG: hypothetical protein ACRCT8_17335 [Lacipirellulaceae bacterium]
MTERPPAARRPGAAPSRSAAQRTVGPALRVSAFDRSSSLVTSLLLVVGLLVLSLGLVYFSAKIRPLPPPIPVTPVNLGGSNDAPAPGDAFDQAAGIPDAPEPDTPTLQSTLDVIGAVVESQAAFYNLEAIDEAAKPARGQGGKGDNRGVGEGGGSGGRGAREPLRELRFEPSSVEEYARWLDEAGIELGVLGNDNRVHYATGLSGLAPRVRKGKPRDERRLYFNSTGGPLDPLDRLLATKAGIGDLGPIVLQFCSQTLQERLLALESDKAGGRPTTKIRRTVFRVTKKGDAFDIKVESQELHP